MDMNSVVRFVDDYSDKNPKTNDSSPGKIDGKKLIKIGLQKERRLLIFKRTKHIIFVLEGTRNIWYKNNFDYPVAVAMGFKASQLKWHPKAVTMERYAQLFIDDADPEWLKINDYELS
jgi:hypothetical protein